MVYTADLKSAAQRLTGSSPVSRTKVLLIELYTLVYEWRAVVYTAREFFLGAHDGNTT